MTPADALAQIEAELAAATPGPWHAHEGTVRAFVGDKVASLSDPPICWCWDKTGNNPNARRPHETDDAHLIAHVPTYLAALVKVVEVANAEHDALTAFLEVFSFTPDDLAQTDAGDQLNACRVHFSRALAALVNAVEP